MQLESVIEKRRSIRKFQERKIPEEKISEVLGLANLAPSAGNLQARRVAVIKEEKIKNKISQATFGQSFVGKAPLIFVVCADLKASAQKYRERGRELYAIQDATILAAYLQLAITDQGLGSCWIGAFSDQKIKEILSLPKELKPIALLPTGFPAEDPSPSSRKKIRELVFDKHETNKK